MIYFKVRGNLGNVLFQYATALSAGVQCRAFTDDPEWGLKEHTMRVMMPGLEVVQKLPPHVKRFVERRFAYDALPDFGNEDVLLEGYFQSERYFDERRVRSAVAMGPAEERDLKARFPQPFEYEDITSIHVRRGDYLKLPHRHPFVGKDYFRCALKRMPEVRHFLVFSNDVPWCRKFFLQEFPDREFFFSEGLSPSDDMRLQSLCRNHIISNSSFSWWGAWLDPNPDKRVIAPSQWFGYDFEKRGEDWQDIYAKGTEIVENPSPLRLRLQARYTHLIDAVRWRLWKYHRSGCAIDG